MKKIIALFISLLSFGLLSAQSINFNNKENLTSLLCNKTWIRYYVNDNQTISDSIKDSIKFYTNGTFYKSESPKNHYLTHQIETGKWDFGSTGKASRTDSASNYISIVMDCPHSNYTSEFHLELYDWHKIQDKEVRKMSGNIEKPYIGFHWRNDSLHTQGLFCYKQKR